MSFMFGRLNCAFTEIPLSNVSTNGELAAKDEPRMSQQPSTLPQLTKISALPFERRRRPEATNRRRRPTADQPQLKKGLQTEVSQASNQDQYSTVLRQPPEAPLSSCASFIARRRGSSLGGGGENWEGEETWWLNIFTKPVFCDATLLILQ
ncbi:hypothetical protein BDDG_05193 [Blastomyces dermatitidis ATCC 18188]|uniref:Uncharacterized protein n=1 Tax=Ajellomyces dermatitidis (strain ATCC 18188 / CBS 674.68) TaxID=653446 RepID=F2TG87_AJEDA|nr:hypothetical protein BDDG_05193 [Blastomyces dermatitidis ATCC 18188]